MPDIGYEIGQVFRGEDGLWLWWLRRW